MKFKKQQRMYLETRQRTCFEEEGVLAQLCDVLKMRAENGPPD